MQVAQLAYFRDRARMVEMVFTAGLNPPALGRTGSSPVLGTTIDCNEMSKISTLDVRQEIGFIKISDSLEIKIKKDLPSICLYREGSPVMVVDKEEIRHLIVALKLADTLLDLNED